MINFKRKRDLKYIFTTHYSIKYKEIKESTMYLTPNQEDIIEEKETLRDLGIILDLLCSHCHSKHENWVDI